MTICAHLIRCSPCSRKPAMQTLALRKGGLLTDLSSTATAEPTCVLPSKRSPGHRGRERKKQPLSHFHLHPSQPPPLCLAMLVGRGLGGRIHRATYPSGREVSQKGVTASRANTAPQGRQERSQMPLEWDKSLSRRQG